jgi:hypothetical protein
MKKVLFLFLVSPIFLSFFSCKTGTIDPLTLAFNLETETQILKVRGMKASDTTLTKNVAIDVVQLLKEKGITNLNRVSSFYIDALVLNFNKGLCEKLENYEISVTFPFTPTPETVKATKATDDCSILTQDPTGLLSLPLVIDSTTTNAQYKKILATNWAPVLKNGEKILVTVKLKAAQDFETAVGANVSLKAHGQLGL